MKAIWVSTGMVFSALVIHAQNSAVLPVPAQQSLVNKYCAGCHNEKLKSGGFSWNSVDLAHPAQNAEQAEKVVRKLRAGLMPPPGAPRPDPSSLKAFASSIETAIDQVAAAHPSAGAPDLHRLNRTEYHDSIRDLLNLDVDVSALLPPDDMSHGFDNMADALSVTPALMQGYIRAAGRISRLAVGDTETAPSMTMYNVPKVVNQMRHVDGAPLGTRGGVSVTHDFPADGEYIFKVVLYYWYTEQLFGSNLPKPVEGQEIEVSVDGERAAVFTIDPSVPETKANFVSGPIKVKAGPHRLSAAFLSKFDGPIIDTYRMEEQTLVDVSTGLQPGMTTLPHLHTLAVTGPMKVTGVSETPSRTKIFSCHPAKDSDEVPCARRIISSVARQAYRRPVSELDIEELLTQYQSGRNKGNFETGIRMALQAIIVNPQFVFRLENAPAGAAVGTNYRISDLEMASRLSYFLWSSLPDEELIGLASQGKLKDPVVLERQVRRMLTDRKSQALSANFAYQWLHLQNLKEADPDGLLFPNFTRNLAQSMTRETELVFDNIMREDRSPLELLTADYTFVDEVLAKHYGIPNIVGTRFQRVPITDSRRFGLLGQGSFLTLTSQANRTSPVQRGKYVMEALLGTPPPNPPPNVPPLKENSNPNEKQFSVRERMEQHRADEPCRSCHQLMDPIGLALENYDPVGIWRTKDSGLPIDASGQMFDGTKLDGPVALRNAILAHSDSYIGNFTENLLAYGLGRVLDYRDMPAVRVVERDAAKNKDRFSAFVLSIVKSTPFQMRRVEPADAASAAVGDKNN